MSKKNSFGPIFFAFLGGAVLTGSAFLVMNGGLREVPPELKRQDKISGDPPPKAAEVTIYTPKFDDKGSVSFEGKAQKIEPGAEDTAVLDAVNAYLGNAAAVPKDAKLMSIKMDGTTAILDFNAAFRAGYGTDEESAVINGVLVTLGQFPQIKKALFRVEGKPLDTLGVMDLSEPLDVASPSDF